MTTKSCPTCDKEFKVVLHAAKYCSEEREKAAASQYIEMKFTTAADMLREELDKIK